MGILAFDAWAGRHTKTMPLTSLRGSVIGIDAIYYLENLPENSREPLLSALGGFPFELESVIIKHLNELQSAGLKPHFVFNGLDHGVKDDPFGPSITLARANAAAFEIYERDLASDTLSRFKASGAPTPTDLSEFLKKTLHEHDIAFTVAPYSALAQLAYYEKHPSQFIDAIYGPSEVLLYGVDKLVTKLSLAYTTQETNARQVFSLDDSTFQWLDRRTCLEELGQIPPSVFVDACLLAGSNLLRTFPPLDNPALYSKGYSIRDVVSLIASCGHNVTAVCAQYQSDSQVKELDYLDRYRRAFMSLKHHIVMTGDGNVETLDKEHAPSDVHDFIGQRLPEELNMYLSRGMLRPRVLNWMTSGMILITAPYGGGDSLEYQDLVKNRLEPMRRQALCLLSDSLHRYYQRKEITTKVWFDADYDAKVNIKDLLPSPKGLLSTWHVRGDTIVEQRRLMETTSENIVPGSLSFAVRSLSNIGFASKTITSKPKDEEQFLKTRHEITANVIWRFLQLRGYVDEQHQLTPWGKVLEATLTTAGSNKDLEEAGFLAIELMRVGLINADTMFLDYSGAPMRGTEVDKRNCMLVSRVACLGKLRSPPTGYSGPLSRHLLAYHSVVSAVQASLRDLMEMSLATLLLEGTVDRDRDDWMDLSLGLPFYDENSCALGNVIKTYLDELCTFDDPTSISTRAEMKTRCQGWFQYCDCEGSIDEALHLWDAVYTGVKAAGKEVKDALMWDEVNQWLSQRR